MKLVKLLLIGMLGASLVLAQNPKIAVLDLKASTYFDKEEIQIDRFQRFPAPLFADL